MVHLDSKRKNLLPPLHGLLFLISNNRYVIHIIPQTGQYIPKHVTEVQEHWLTQEIAPLVNCGIDPMIQITMSVHSTMGETSEFSLSEMYFSIK